MVVIFWKILITILRNHLEIEWNSKIEKLCSLIDGIFQITSSLIRKKFKFQMDENHFFRFLESNSKIPQNLKIGKLFPCDEKNSIGSSRVNDKIGDKDRIRLKRCTEGETTLTISTL